MWNGTFICNKAFVQNKVLGWNQRGAHLPGQTRHTGGTDSMVQGNFKKTRSGINGLGAWLEPSFI